MSIREILGPVMVGPSSSHTLGALRIARFAYKFGGGVPDEVVFTLHGSFAETHRGHGTDRALIAGILGIKPDDERIKEALSIAKRKGLKYRIKDGDLGEVHPNTVLIYFKKDGKKYSIMGSSIGGGEIRIIKINDVNCGLEWEYNTVVITMKDVSGALAEVLRCIPQNIANLYMRRVNAVDKRAVALVEIDEPLSTYTFEKLKENRFVYEAYYIPRD